LFLAALAMIATGILVVPKAYARFVEQSPRPAQGTVKAVSHSLKTAVQAAAPPLLEAGPVTVPATKFFSWALYDRKSGQLAGSPNMSTQTNSTESMVKIWLVSEYLRRFTEKGQSPTPAQLSTASTAIRDSNDTSAQTIYKANGGNASITRLISLCGLTETKVYSGSWSRTQMSARDAVRMGLCVSDGRAAGPQWTKWVLDEMRQVRGGVLDQPARFAPTGGGRWGIIDGLPAEVAPATSIKNGWTPLWADGLWHINCLAVHEEFILAVQVRFPINTSQPVAGLQYGADICKSVTVQLVHNAEVR